MKKEYIKPETELLFVEAHAILNTDSEGEWGGADANQGLFDDEDDGNGSVSSQNPFGLWDNE